MEKNKELPKTYTKKELAEILQVTTVTINRYMAQGLINQVILNGAVRFTEQEVNRLLGVK